MNSKPLNTTPKFITPRKIGIFALILVSAVGAIIFLLVPEGLQPSLLFIFPSLFIGIWILTNPWVGIYLFYLYAILRPYDIIPALGPLRLTMAIEVVTLVSFSIYLIRTRASLKWHFINWMFLGFIGVLAAGVLLAANNRFAYDTFEAMVITYTMYLIATNIVDSLDRMTKLIWLILIIHSYFALKGIVNFEIFHTTVGIQMSSGKVGTGFIADENDFALALVTWAPMAFFMFVSFEDTRRKLISLFFLGSFTWGIVCSQSRGGLVALVVAVAFGIANSRRKMLAIGLASLAVLGFIMVAPPQYYAKVRTTTQVNVGTADERIRSWKAGFRMYLDHPIVGVGGENSGIYLPSYISGVEEPSRYWGRALHGTIPQVAAETGTLGLVFYGGMIFVALRQLRRIKRESANSVESARVAFLANSLMGGIIAYLVGATFLSTAYYPHLWLLLLLTVILTHVTSSSATRDGKNAPTSGQAAPISPTD